MNWPLKPRTENVTPPLEGHFPTFLEQWTARKHEKAVRSDSWNHKAKIEADVMEQAYAALEGPDYAKTPEYQQGAQLYGQTLTAGIGNPDPRDMQKLTFRLSSDEIFARVQEGRQFDPQKFGVLPASRAELEAEVNRRRQRELDDAAAVLRYSDSSVARFGGDMAAALTDEWSLPFLAVGAPLEGAGVKAFARMVATEGAINAALEVPQVVKQRQVAKEMGFEPTNPVEQIGIAGAAGAAFAGVLGGVGRALGYAVTRNTAEAAAHAAERSGVAGELATDAAEKAMREGKEPPAPRALALPDVGPDAPSNWAAIRGGIFAGESGGDYNALFGFSNRSGGPFADVKLTEMTVDQAIAFSAPDGAYGQWVKGQIGRVATPMGGYQIVGTTLRQAKTALGLKGDELMTPALQERLGQWIYRAQGTGAWEGYRGPDAGFVPGDGGSYRGPATSSTGRRFATLPNEMVTPAGTRVQVRYRVVDLADLKAASGDLQPRDRTRAASDEQIAEIAARLDPERLMPSVETDRGAPLVGPDMMVESGNGRVAALNRAVTENPQAYAAYVERVRSQFDVPEGVQRPVLIAERVGDVTPEQRIAIVRESNTSSIGRMAPSEQAKLEAGYLDARAFGAYHSGKGLNTPENTGFVRRMLSLMPQTERAAMLTDEGRLNIDGIRRVRQALFARAFEADDLLKLVAETENPAIEGLLRMLEDVAPDWAAFRSMVEAGYVRAEFDLTRQLMETVRMIARARSEGRDGQSVIAAIRDRLAQGDMFGENDPLTEALLAVFYKGDRPRSAEASKDILRRYAAEAVQVGRADMETLVGEAVKPRDALARAVEGYDARTAYTPAALPADAPPEPAVAPLGDISTLDTARFADGAASPAVERANDAIEAELRAQSDAPPEQAMQPSDSTLAQIEQAKADWADRRQETFRLGGENSPEVSIGDVLDDLDADQNLIAAMTSCALKGVL